MSRTKMKIVEHPCSVPFWVPFKTRFLEHSHSIPFSDLLPDLHWCLISNGGCVKYNTNSFLCVICQWRLKCDLIIEVWSCTVERHYNPGKIFVFKSPIASANHYYKLTAHINAMDNHLVVTALLLWLRQ